MLLLRSLLLLHLLLPLLELLLLPLLHLLLRLRVMGRHVPLLLVRLLAGGLGPWNELRRVGIEACVPDGPPLRGRRAALRGVGRGGSLGGVGRTSAVRYVLRRIRSSVGVAGPLLLHLTLRWRRSI